MSVAHPILARVAAVGGRVFTDGDHNLNIVGIRAAPATPNRFDDQLHCIYKSGGQWVDRWWPITTDPGMYWLHHPMNAAGCAAVVADRHYPGLWRLGLHRGRYKALVQRGGGPIAVHRDDNTDSQVDYREDNIQVGMFGINCHRATTRKGGSVAVNKWSAGCQVFADPVDFDTFIRICERQRALRGWNSFSYTLLNGWI